MAATQGRLADWTWTKERFEEVFGRRLSGGFVERWPAGKRIAVLLTFDTQADVDAAVPNYVAGQTCFWANGSINYCDLTMRQYDVLEGVPRMLRILRELGVKATFPTCGLTAEWYPDTVRAIVAEGHEVAVHGYYHAPMSELTPEEQRLEAERATEAIARVAGTQPAGWRCPLYSITEHTLDHLRDLGYRWNSDFHDCDFPYLLSKDGREIVEIPAGHDDWTAYLQYAPGSPQMGGTPYGTYDGVLGTMKAEFDLLYRESAEEPRVFQFCMHPKITGRPFRAAVLDDLIRHMKEHDGVWFATCEEIAALA
jgi:peptidoglycan/xylan/chitin deacetylase (PgdA/CDA1 family)